MTNRITNGNLEAQAKQINGGVSLIIIEVADRDTAIGLLGNIEEHLDRTVDENETAKIIGTRIQ